MSRTLSQMRIDYALDTSVLVDLINQRPGIQPHLAAAGRLYFTVTVLGGLLYGARHPLNPIRARADVLAITQTVTLLGTDAATAERYGDIKPDLRVSGQINS